MKSIVRVAAAALTILNVTLAMAAEPTPAAQEEGRERFNRGVELFRDGDFRTALIEFNRANEIAPSWRIQYNIGQTCLELQDYACALRAFDHYLNKGGKDVPKERRESSEREVLRLRKLVGTVKVTANREGADVLVDDVVVAKTPVAEPLVVSAGRHRITVSQPPLTSTKLIDVAGGDNANVEIELNEPTAPKADQPRYSTTEPPAPPPKSSKTGAWIALGTTGVLAAGATVTGILALSAKSDLDDTANRADVSAGDVDSAQSKTRTLSLVTDILVGATIVGAGVTAVLFLTGGSSSSSGKAPSAPTGVRVGVGPGSAMLSGSF